MTVCFFFFAITYTGPPKLAKRELNKLKKFAFLKVGELWHKRMMPLHFRASAVRKYGYATRSRKYKARKLRVKGHKKPLVWSGQSLRRAKRRDVRPTSKGVRVLLHAPALNLGGRSGLGPNMRKEVLTVLPHEKRSLLAEFRKRMEGAMKASQSRKTVVLK